MRAFGSARMTSPSIAKLAVTPPVVGSVRTEMNGKRSSWSRASAAEILPICIRLSVPSCIRAPPEAAKIMTAPRWSTAYSINLVIFSPTAEPIEPPMNDMSIAPTNVRCPPTIPLPEIIASGRPDNSLACTIRSLYAFESVKLSGSPDVTSSSSFSYRPSSNRSFKRPSAG